MQKQVLSGSDLGPRFQDFQQLFYSATPPQTYMF